MGKTLAEERAEMQISEGTIFITKDRQRRVAATAVGTRTRMKQLYGTSVVRQQAIHSGTGWAKVRDGAHVLGSGGRKTSERGKKRPPAGQDDTMEDDKGGGWSGADQYCWWAVGAGRRT